MRRPPALLVAALLGLAGCTPEAQPPRPPVPEGPPRPAPAAATAATAAPASPSGAGAEDPAGLVSPARPGLRSLSIAELYKTTALWGVAASPDGARVAFGGNASGRYNLWIADAATGAARQLTKSDQRQGLPCFSPDGAWIAFQSDTNGDELWDIFLVRSDGSELKNVTSTKAVAERRPVFSPDGRWLAYLSKAKTAPASEVELFDLKRRTTRKVTSGTRAGLTNQRPVFSSDGRLLAYTQGDNAGKNTNIYLFDLERSTRTLLTPHEGEHAYVAADFSPDGKKLLIGSNAKNGQDGVALLDIERREIEWLVSDDWPADPGSFSPDGKRVSLTRNVDGNRDIALYDLDRKALEPLPLRKGVNSLLFPLTSFSRDGSQLFYLYNGPDAPGDVWVHALATGASRQVTRSLPAGIDSADLVSPSLIHFRSTDGRWTISAFVYVPYNLARDGRGAAVVVVHGGPTGQFMNSFNKDIQYLVNQGYMVIAPNFRGSTGYGEAFQFANRRDWGGGDLADVRDAADWVRRTGFVDPKKIAILGASYGGYMTMMGLTKQPDSWAAGVSIVPFVNLFTEFEHEDAELREYDRFYMGDPESNKALWEDRSPINFIDRIKAPVLLLAGGNDPRDPPTEALQVADAIQKRGGVVEIKVYPDEGHSFAKLENQLDAYQRIADFLRKHVPPR